MAYFDLTKTQEKTPPKKPLENTKNTQPVDQKLRLPENGESSVGLPKGPNPYPPCPPWGLRQKRCASPGTFGDGKMEVSFENPQEICRKIIGGGRAMMWKVWVVFLWIPKFGAEFPANHVADPPGAKVWSLTFGMKHDRFSVEPGTIWTL